PGECSSTRYFFDRRCASALAYERCGFQASRESNRNATLLGLRRCAMRGLGRDRNVLHAIQHVSLVLPARTSLSRGSDLAAPGGCDFMGVKRLAPRAFNPARKLVCDYCSRRLSFGGRMAFFRCCNANTGDDEPPLEAVRKGTHSQHARPPCDCEPGCAFFGP